MVGAAIVAIMAGMWLWMLAEALIERGEGE